MWQAEDREKGKSAEKDRGSGFNQDGERNGAHVDADAFEPVRIVDTRNPRPLVVHLVLYGIVLSFLHTLGRRVLYGEVFSTAEVGAIADQGSIPVAIGALLAVGVVVVLYLRHEFRFSAVWTLVRKAVFTLAVLEFLLVPLISVIMPAVVMGDCAFVLYQMLFFIGCYFIWRESDSTASGLLAWGLALLSLGQVLGGLSLEYSVRTVLGDSTLFAVLRVLAFLLCTIATFWVGSDDEIRKLWGLRREQTPKQYKNALLQRKCQALGALYGLTKREQEVLVLLAQGMRAEQVAETLYISQNTVRTHIQNAYAKLDIHSVKALHAALDAVTVEE